MAAQEIPGSNPTCETIDVRSGATVGGNLDVGGTLTVGGVPVVPTGITTEHVDVASTTGNVSQAKTVSFCDYTGLSPESPLGVAVALDDGVTDGQQKQILLAPHANVTWSIAPATFLDGVDVAFATSAPGAALLVWDATAIGWRLLADNGGTVA